MVDPPDDTEAPTASLFDLPRIMAIKPLTDEQIRADMRSDLAAAIDSFPNRFRDLSWKVAAGRLVASPAGGTALARARGERDGAIDVTFIGPAGIGKTTLACALADAWLFNERIPLGLRRGLRFFSARNLGTRRDRAELAAAAAAPVAIIDDVGAEEPSMFGRAAIAQVLGERHDWARPTVITSGMLEAEVVAAYGDGIARRMFERSVLISWGLK